MWDVIQKSIKNNTSSTVDWQVSNLHSKLALHLMVNQYFWKVYALSILKEGYFDKDVNKIAKI